MARGGRAGDNVEGARLLRRRMTSSERVLWQVLRGSQYRGLKFRRQHPVGPFVLDFYCEQLKLAIEVDGGVHELAEVRSRDRQRQEILEELGIRVLRLGAGDVMLDPHGALEAGLRAYVDPAASRRPS
jgi:very-short-patch-repair endonuclease